MANCDLVTPPCVLPPQEVSASYIGVFDSTGCLRVLHKPSHPALIYCDGTDVFFVDGSSGINLPQFLSQVAGTANKVVIQSGNLIKAMSPDPAIGSRQFFVYDGGALKFINDPTSPLPVGPGILASQPGPLAPAFITAHGVPVIKQDGSVIMLPIGANGTVLGVSSNEFAFVAGSAVGGTGSVGAGMSSVIGKSTSTSSVQVKTPQITCFDISGNPYILTSVTATADLTAAVGVGGLDAGVEASNTWYYLYIVTDGSGGDGMMISTSASNPNLSSTTMVAWALVGLFRNDASGNIVPYQQRGRRFFISQTNVVTNGSVTTSLTAMPISNFNYVVPPNVQTVSGIVGADGTVSGSLAAQIQVASDTTGFGIMFPGNQAVGTVAYMNFRQAVGTFIDLLISDNASPQVCWRAIAAAVHQRCDITGYTI